MQTINDKTPPRCRHCGSEKTRLIVRFTDPRTGHSVRVFKCECGQRLCDE